MSRDFVKSTSNRLSLGANLLNPLLERAEQISFHAWIVIDSTTTFANDNRVISILISGGTTSGLSLSVEHSGSNRLVRVGARSESADTYRTLDGVTALDTGVWYSIGGIFDFRGGFLTVYLNGSLDSRGSAAWGQTAYAPSASTGNDGIGCVFNGTFPVGTSTQFDGRIAEVAIWRQNIGNVAFAELARGFTPLARYSAGARSLTEAFPSLVAYLPLYGIDSPEPDLTGNGIKGTISGTLNPCDHPRIATRVWSDFPTLSSVIKTGTESLTVSESATNLLVSASDSASTSESASLPFTGTDSAVLAETALVAQTGSDAASQSESALPLHSGADSANAVETAVQVRVATTDQATVTDSATVSSAASGSDAVLVSDSASSPQVGSGSRAIIPIIGRVPGYG